MKKFACFLIAGALINGCALVPEKSIYTEIDIDASRERVWAALADNRNYPDWNPYHVRVEGELKEGETLTVQIEKPNGEQVEIEPTVLEMRENERLVWGGGINGIFIGEHVFELTGSGDGRTRLVQSEVFAGFAVPFASLDAIEEGYNLMNQSLKKYVEAE